ncbi:MAG: sigma-54-dependent Fis family transcriptional regulator [Burkholderiales bacterium]|nr:sigma-54-dependent Fis family transcriptional regulator [Burkholderiales bacterium]
MTKKNLLLVDHDGAELVFAGALLEVGWNVHCVRQPDEARVTAARLGEAVGLLAVAPGMLEDTETIEGLVNAGRVEWIALMPRDLNTSKDPMDGARARLLLSGFYDHHTRPIDVQRLLVILGHAWGRVQLRGHTRSAPLVPESNGMIGASPVMQRLFTHIGRLTQVDAPVLITGESGTGKELVARAIHARSARRDGPFVPVNCGALPDTLVQSELFGHERGAFTGAHQTKPGNIEIADRGTIFLDEIGDLPLDQQVNLLRFLQDRTIVRVGSTRALKIDARVIAATHVDLERAVSEGAFREDLFYRLNVLQLHVPALRDRGPDIELLMRAFFERFAAQKNSGVQGFAQEAVRAAMQYAWPGNVRELMNRVQRGMIMGEHRLITAEDLGLNSGQRSGKVITLSYARDVAERDVIRHTLRSNANNVSRAARELGVSRVTLYRLMGKFDIDLDREA